MKRSISNPVVATTARVTAMLLITVLVSIILYPITATLLSGFIGDGEELIRELNNNWLLMPIAYLPSIVTLLIGLRCSYCLVKQSGLEGYRHAFYVSILITFSLTLLGLTFLSLSGTTALLLAVIIYSLLFYGINTHTRTLPVYIIWIVCVLFVLSLGIYVATRTRVPSQTDYTFLHAIMSPNPVKQNRNPQNTYNIFNVPTEVSVRQQPMYGKILVLHNPGVEKDVYPVQMPITMYQLPKNAWTDPRNCPNISGLRTYDTTNCTKIGSLNGKNVYAVTHYMSSSEILEVFFEFESTVVAFDGQGIDADSAIQYLKTFRKVDQKQLGSEISANKRILLRYPKLHFIRNQ